MSDLEIQISHGDSAGPPLGVHIDNMNSIVHLALSIKGQRTLHISYPDQHRSQYTRSQKEGDVYLSSPWAFRHGVEHPRQTWEERTIAIQCRTLMTVQENSQAWEEIGDADGKAKILAAITDVMEAYPLSMPNLQEVKRIESSLS